MSGEVSKLNMVVYGYSKLNYVITTSLIDETEKFRIRYADAEDCPEFGSFDVVFINYGALGDDYKSELLSRFKEFSKAFREKNTTFCILYNRLPTPFDLGRITVPASQKNLEIAKRWNILAEKDLAHKVLLSIDIENNSFITPETSFDVKREEFRNFIEKYAVTQSYFNSGLSGLKIICEVEKKVTGFALEGKLIILPFLLKRNDNAFVEGAYRVLAEAVLAFKAKMYFEIPEWLEELTYPGEKGLIEEKAKLLKSIEEVKDKGKRYMGFKQVLWLGDDPLVDAVTNFFEEGLGIKTEREERYSEDFWILENNEKIALVEVKGLNDDVKRSSVNQIDTHREVNDLNQNYPALLIVNTFMKGVKSLSDKDKRVASDITQHAVRNNVLVMRTLDLARVLHLIEFGKKTKDEFLKIVSSENGWFKVTGENWEVIKI